MCCTFEGLSALGLVCDNVAEFRFTTTKSRINTINLGNFVLKQQAASLTGPPTDKASCFVSPPCVFHSGILRASLLRDLHPWKSDELPA